ncbi:DNA-binding XRE family transcriptional regulator [Flavobacterium sp. PL11]|uniref:helix-turn-helix domain-containing protein n=1 Tax=Flavobacterium sp. PL11 TaxID=3071717 RepID=UPI002E07A2EA|nr:DNA-binding XRE family transcriptional regulator [Flavobacterium sp. PL11]
MLFFRWWHFYCVKELDEIEIVKSVGNKVRETRILRGLSQATLSYDANIPKNQVGRIERGEISTSIITLFKICKALDIQIQELFI